MTDTKSESPVPGTVVRRLMRGLDRATLATAAKDRAGWPYASLVLVATDLDATPLLMLSDLAEHTANLAADPRVSLLFDGTGDRADPLTGARATVLGRAVKVSDARLLSRYVRRHPSAEMYAGFKDFNLYRVDVEAAHLVAGFGRIHWIGREAVLAPPAPALVEAEAGIVEHMNEDHADAVQLYAARLLGLDGEGWRMTGCDAEGIDLREGGRIARLAFEAPIANAAGARETLVALVRKGRSPDLG